MRHVGPETDRGHPCLTTGIVENANDACWPLVAGLREMELGRQLGVAAKSYNPDRSTIGNISQQGSKRND